MVYSADLLQQLVSDHINFTTVVSKLKVDKRQYVEDRKFYDKVQGREVQWQRKLWLIAKEGEGIARVTRSSQDLTG